MTPDYFTGLNVDALIIGLMSASFATFWLNNVNNFLKAASAVLFSALLSGYGAPVAATYLVNKFTIISQASAALTPLAAVIIGGSVTWGLPILINYVRNKWGGQNA